MIKVEGVYKCHPPFWFEILPSHMYHIKESSVLQRCGCFTLRQPHLVGKSRAFPHFMSSNCRQLQKDRFSHTLDHFMRSGLWSLLRGFQCESELDVAKVSSRVCTLTGAKQALWQI